MTEEKKGWDRYRVAREAAREAARLAQKRIASGPDASAPKSERGAGTPGTGDDSTDKPSEAT
jgi:hypothetical protein